MKNGDLLSILEDFSLMFLNTLEASHLCIPERISKLLRKPLDSLRENPVKVHQNQ